MLRTEAGGRDDDQGMVEFVARYTLGACAERLHEASHFVREDGRWCYVDSELAGGA